MRRRIVLQSRLAGQDTSGQRLLVWTDYLAGLAMATAKTVTGATPGTTTLLQCPAHGWREGQLVRLDGITGAPGLPCTFGVLAPSVNAFSVRLNTAGMPLTLATSTATPVSGVPVEIEPMTGRELLADQSINAELTHRLTLRHHVLLIDPIKVATLRAMHVHGAVTRIFNLSPAVNMESMNRWVTVLASEGLTQG